MTFCSVSTPALGLAGRMLRHRGDMVGQLLVEKGAKTLAKVLPGSGSLMAVVRWEEEKALTISWGQLG